MVLGGESGDIHIWEADTLREIARHKAHSGMEYTYTLRVHVRGALHYVHMYVLSFQVSTQSSLCMYCLLFSGTVTCLDMSSDGSRLVSGSKDKCVGVWLVTGTHQQSS